jgi:hypothetical protein
MTWVLTVAIALALSGCTSRPTTVAAPGDLGLDCVWSWCASKSIALSRCAGSEANLDTPAFRHCMRYEGYQARSCDAGTPDCSPKILLLP